MDPDKNLLWKDSSQGKSGRLRTSGAVLSALLMYGVTQGDLWRPLGAWDVDQLLLAALQLVQNVHTFVEALQGNVHVHM